MCDSIEQSGCLIQVNWSVLWRTWLERDIREIIVLPLIVLIILVPIGLFTGMHCVLLPFWCLVVMAITQTHLLYLLISLTSSLAYATNLGCHCMHCVSLCPVQS